MGIINLWLSAKGGYICPACSQQVTAASRTCPACGEVLTYKMSPKQEEAHEVCMLRIKSGLRCDRCQFWTAPEDRHKRGNQMSWRMCPLNWRPKPPERLVDYINERRTSYHVHTERDGL